MLSSTQLSHVFETKDVPHDAVVNMGIVENGSMTFLRCRREQIEFDGEAIVIDDRQDKYTYFRDDERVMACSLTIVPLDAVACVDVDWEE